VRGACDLAMVPHVDWGFIWLMFILKVPIVALLVIVWWAVRQSPEESEQPGGGDGGIKRPPHPRRPFPRRPRRGPHGDPAPASPPRTRSVLVKAKRVDA
jgi:hypothetical protein